MAVYERTYSESLKQRQWRGGQKRSGTGTETIFANYTGVQGFGPRWVFVCQNNKAYNLVTAQVKGTLIGK